MSDERWFTDEETLERTLMRRLPDGTWRETRRRPTRLSLMRERTMEDVRSIAQGSTVCTWPSCGHTARGQCGAKLEAPMSTRSAPPISAAPAVPERRDEAWAKPRGIFPVPPKAHLFGRSGLGVKSLCGVRRHSPGMIVPSPDEERCGRCLKIQRRREEKRA